MPNPDDLVDYVPALEGSPRFRVPRAVAEALKWADDATVNTIALAAAAEGASRRDETPETKKRREQGPWGAEDVMCKIGGKSFRCSCGCNVFKKAPPDRFKCNGCGAVYVGS